MDVAELLEVVELVGVVELVDEELEPRLVDEAELETEEVEADEVVEVVDEEGPVPVCVLLAEDNADEEVVGPVVLLC